MDKPIKIPASARAQIIGRGGQNIKAIEGATGARIQVPRANPNETEDDEIEIMVTGNTVNIAMAHQRISEKIGERPNNAAVSLSDIPHEFIYFLGGPNSSGFEELQKAHGVEITLPEFKPVYPETSMPEEGEDGPVFYKGQHCDCIRLSGPRTGVQTAREAIERKVAALQNSLLLQLDQGLERNMVQYLFENNLRMADFWNETQCVMIVPEAETDTSIRIVGPSADAIQNALDLCEERSAEFVKTGKIDTKIFGGGECCWNLARYLREVGEIERLEKQHSVRLVTPMTLEGATNWDILASQHRNMTETRREASQIANAFPGYRMKTIGMNSFFHNHIKQYFAPELHSNYGVRAVVPSLKEPGVDVLLVYEGPQSDGQFQVPRATSKPSKEEARVQAKQFKTALEQAEKHLMEFLSKQGDVSETSVKVPRKYHDKLRKFLKEEQNKERGKETPVVRAWGASTKQDPDTVNLSGPTKSLNATITKIEAFVQREQEFDKERDYTDSCDFPQKFASHLVGRGGQNISQLREKHDVEIQVKEGKVEFKGPKVKVDAAKREINALAKQLEDETTHIIKVDPKYHSNIIGRDGASVRKVESLHKVRVIFPHTRPDSLSDQDSDSGKTRRPQKADEVIIRGGRKGADEARSDILELVNYLRDTGHEDVVTVKQKHISKLIGAGGKAMDEVRQDTGARIDIPDPKKSQADLEDEVEISIKGTKEAVQAAKKTLLQKKAILEDVVIRTVCVNPKYHRGLIGSGGNNIAKIILEAGGPKERHEHSRMVRIPNEGDTNADNITVQGPQAVVDKIVSAIETIVAQRESELTDSIDVPVDKHSGLIGRGGEKKRQMETQFKVSINVPRQGDGRTDVRITGEPENVEKAKAHIESIIQQQQGETIQVPRKMHHSISNNGRFFRDVRSQYKVQIDHAGHKIPAKPTATESQSTAPLVTDDGSDDAIPHRWTITKASTEEGNIPWVLRGSPENVVEVKALIEKQLAKTKTVDTRGTLDLEDTSVYRFIIGTGGRTIENIRNESGCDIQVPRKDSDKGITIVGSGDGVEKAKDLILGAIRDGKTSRRE